MRTLNRWLLVLVPLLVIATVAWRYRQHVRQEYPLIVETGRTEGIPALEAGDFDKAHQLLSAARTAVDGLGGAVDGADEIRQAADEAAIFVNLITRGPGRPAGRGRANRSDQLGLASSTRSTKGGRSSSIRSSPPCPTDASPSRYELALRILPPGEATNREGRPDRGRRVRSDGLSSCSSWRDRQSATR